MNIIKENRPREKAKKFGVNNLSDSELLAIILRTGNNHQNVLELSQEIVNSIDNFNDLNINELKRFNGIGEIRAIEILGAIEFGKRVVSVSDSKKFINSPKDVNDLLYYDLNKELQEHFICIYLGTKNEIIKVTKLFTGTLNSSQVHPREIFKGAIKSSANSIVCVHNHPSGNPEPSLADINLTTALVKLGEELQIEIVDHIIIADNGYISLKERGLI